MYLSDLIREVITPKLKQLCVGQSVSFIDIDGHKHTIVCLDVNFGDDDGYCWLEFTDQNGNSYTVDGQGIDVYFELINSN